MGAQRRAHHRQQEAMRAASAEADRMKAVLESQQQAFRQQLDVQREAMMAQTESLREAMTPPVATGAVGGEVRTARSKRATTTGMSKGIATLRIPLNIGGGSAAGLNIG